MYRYFTLTNFYRYIDVLDKFVDGTIMRSARPEVWPLLV
jgi:hypothetical protein